MTSRSDFQQWKVGVKAIAAVAIGLVMGVLMAMLPFSALVFVAELVFDVRWEGWHGAGVLVGLIVFGPFGVSIMLDAAAEVEKRRNA